MGRIQTARHDGLLRRLFSIKGGGSLMPESLEDAFPTLPLEGGPIELLKLAGWGLGFSGALRTSPVGQTVGWQLFNPPDSGMIVVPTRAFFTVDAQGIIFLGVTTVALATAATGRFRDTRGDASARTTALVRTGNAPASPTNAIRLRPRADIQQTIDDSDGLAVLAPGTGLTFVSVATNLTIECGFFWRERSAEPSELNF